jgi:predicted N-acetyltransferase YhbS
VEIRRLRAGDDRSRFRSGDPDLDRFFRSYAGQNQFRHHVGVTYVAAENGDVLRLARLAVDSKVRGRGLGEQLLRFALALTMTEDYGCVGIAVDAKPGAGTFYARYGFRAIDVVEGHSDARPRPTPMFLPTSEILAATPRRPRR